MSFILPWIRLLNGLKYSVFFGVVLLYLPFTAIADAPLSGMLGGLFSELTAWSVFWISIAFFAASWSLMTTTGLLADGLKLRRPEIGQGDYLPRAAADFLGLPITKGQTLLFSGFAVVQTAVVVVAALGSKLQAGFAALAGAVAAYLVMILLAVPAHLAIAEFHPLPRWWLVNKIWDLFRPFKPLAEFLYRLVEKLFRFFRLTFHKLSADNRAAHFYALTTALGILVLLVAVGWAFFPPNPKLAVHPPAGAYLYALLLLLVWTLSGLDFHLSRLRISPLLVLLLMTAVVFAVTRADHYYDAEAVDASAAGGPLSPVDVAAASLAPDNLVIVASSGGGILAAGWTTLVLRHMLEERPQLAREIRLLSTASGGSVGASYYTLALDSLPDAQRDPASLKDALERAFDLSVESSLDATAYGLALLDFERIFVGNALPVLRQWDRGLLLENSWERISGEKPTLFEMRPRIREGTLPALILNSTVMERGHRLMLTPIDFSDVPGPHAPTQTGLLGAPGQEIDIGLWTAARLSATFPYVSPAARSDLDEAAGGEGRVDRDRAYHMIDGGYYDNFGIASALDWLWPVLQAQAAGTGTLQFKKVLLIQLNPFPAGRPPQPKAGLPSAVAGPLLALVALRNGTQITRNAIDVENALTSWRARLGPGVCLGTLEMRPPEGTPDGPLSWHLTQSQKMTLERSWDLVIDDWKEIESFLNFDGCPPGTSVPPVTDAAAAGGEGASSGGA